MWAGGSTLEGGGEVVTAASPFPCLAEVFKHCPIVLGEVCVYTHLSSRLPSGTQPPTEHSLVSAGRF